MPNHGQPPPALHVGQVQAWVGPAALQRGRWYQQQGRVRYPRWRANELHALCQGQAREPYRVWVRLQASEGIVAAGCTCPAGREGRCKHVAAVALLWAANPQAFVPALPVASIVRTWNRQALVALITALVDACPDLEALVPVFQPSADDKDASTDIDKPSDC